MAGNWWQKVMLRHGSRLTGRATPPQLRLEVLEVRENPAATAGLFATVVAAGAAPVVPVFDASTQAQKFTINAYESTFTGGVNVAVGDLTGSGTDDIVTGAGPGGGPVIKVFSGTDGSLLKTFTIGDATSRAGVSVAVADIEGTGKADIVVGTMSGGQPLVEVIRFADGSVVKSFTPFAGSTGVSVAVGDVNGDKTPDVVAGSGVGVASQVVVFDGKTGTQLLNVAPFEATFTGGVTVSTGDLDGDGKADVIVSAGPGGGPRVEVYGGATGQVIQNFFAYDSTQRAGALATAFDSSGSGSLNLVTTDGPGQTASPKAFNWQTLAPLSPPTLPYLPVSVLAPGVTSTLPFSLTDPAWQTLSSGVRIWDVTQGTGTAVKAGDQITVNYTGYLLNGTVFDSSISRNQPFSATLTTSNLIAGWVDGIPGMKPGGERRLDIPASLAYGAAGQGSIPPNAELVFDITLISSP